MAAANQPIWQDISFTARDGLRIHARRYGASGLRRRPVLCLAGLTRNSSDFHEIARALSQGDQPRAVYTMDYRGRGRSDFDPDWKNYAIPVEMQDVIDLATLAGLHGACLLGTSRGGLISMVLAAAQPGIIGAAILNDIGPVVEREGLARIAGYVGKTPLPASWAEAAKIAASLNERQFPRVPAAEWDAIARQLYNERDGRPAPGYDPKLANALSVFDGPIPALWAQFEALKHVPVMVLRGVNSDILSAATVREMGVRHPRLTAHEVPAEGHAPLLRDEPTIAAVRKFLEAHDVAGQHPAVEAA